MSDNEDFLDLELCELPRVGPGRQPANVTAEFVRELTEADLQAPIVQTQTAPSIKKIRDTHHALARILASGESEGMASKITGYSPSRISILKADPQFQDLLEFYRQGAIDENEHFRSRMVTVGMTALQELAERLEDNPDKISDAMLNDIIKNMADRTGYAPASKAQAGAVNVNINLRDAMAEARARVNALREAQAPKVIDHE